MAATLAWNPVRAVVGRAGPRITVVDASDAGARQASRGKKRADAGEIPDASGDDLALSLEPSPEEMPGIDTTAGVADIELLEDDRLLDEPKRKKKKSKAEAAAQHDADIAAAIDATAYVDLSGDELPSPELLTPPAPRNGEASKRELDAMGLKLMDALRTFRVDGELVGTDDGSGRTQFEVEPAPGVKVRQFANLSNDLALAMRAASIRIVAPIPGRGAVGVEVPNPISEIVSFRELIEARDYQSARAALPIALGKDLEGKPVIADLAKMPHLLIAGATGSGKSVCVNTHHHEPRLPSHAADAALPDGRPEDGRALGVQHAAAPAPQGRSPTTATPRRCSSGR